MLFAHLTVVGIGLIGGSFALAAKQAGLVGQVTGVARSEATRQGALEIGAADEVTEDLEQAVAQADLVYLATPVETICAQLRTLGPYLRPGALVTDAGSAKAAVMQAAQALPRRVTFVGGHPMAGSEKTGIAAARPDLFADSSYFLTPGPKTPPEPVQQLVELVRGVGARPLVVEAERHDRLVALTSHLPHLLAWALCATAGDMEDPEALAPYLGGAWRDVTRIAGSNPEMWSDILRANAGNLAEALHYLSAELGLATERLKQGDRGPLLAWLQLAHNTHERIAES